MKILVDIPDNKASFFIEMLRNMRFGKAKPLSEEKARILQGLKDAVADVEKHKEGKTKLKSARQLLNEL